MGLWGCCWCRRFGGSRGACGWARPPGIEVTGPGKQSPFGTGCGRGVCCQPRRGCSPSRAPTRRRPYQLAQIGEGVVENKGNHRGIAPTGSACEGSLPIAHCPLPIARKRNGRTGGWSRSAYFFGGKFRRSPMAGRCLAWIDGRWLVLDRSVLIIRSGFAYNHYQSDPKIGPFARNRMRSWEFGVWS